MWKIFINNELDVNQTFEALNIWKNLVYSKLNIKVKKYLAEKIVVYFDNKVLFKKDGSVHDMLMSALSQTEKDIEEMQSIFPDVKCFIIPEDKNSILITFNLPESKEYYPEEEFRFNLIQKNIDFNYEKIKQFKNKAWENLIFSLEITDLANSWINYTPSLEKRVELQTKYILLNKNFKNEELSLLEKINLEENITKTQNYKELYKKIEKIMPQIEDKLNIEWRDVVTQGDIPLINIKKKNQI